MKITSINKVKPISDSRRAIYTLIDNEKVDLCIVQLHKGNSTNRHYHKFTIELFYILDGVGEVNTEIGGVKNKTKIHKGDSFIIEPPKIHSIKTVSGLKFIKINIPRFDKTDIYEAK